MSMKDIANNIKGAWNDFLLRPKREEAFVCNCKKLEKTERFKEMYEGGKFNPQKKTFVTPNILKLIFGKKGFLQEGVILNYGEFSKLAKASRAAYMALKLDNMSEEIKKSSELKVADLIDKINEIGKLFEQLSRDTRFSLGNSTNKFLASSVNLASSIAFVSGCGVVVESAVVTAACACTTPFFVAGFGAWSGCVGLSFGAGNVALLAGCAVAGYVGAAIAAISLLVIAINQIRRKIKDYEKHKKDMEILAKIEKKLSEIKTYIKKINTDFDKYGAKSGKLVSFLEQQSGIWERYANNNSRIKRVKNQKIRTIKKYGEVGRSMDIYKMMIAKMITNLVLADADKFAKKVKEETEKKLAAQCKEKTLN